MRARLTLAMLTGTAALGAGLGLTAVAAWLITTAAGQPFIAELLVAVVAVRAFGISKGVLRYAERLLSHDLAFRALGVLRLRVYDRLARLAPAGLAAFRRGDLLARLVDDVRTVQDRYPRVLVPGVSAAAAGLLAVVIATVVLPAAGLVLLAGLAVGAVGIPRLSLWVTAWADRRLVSERAELSARLVESLDAAEELAVLGAQPERAEQTGRSARRLAKAETRLSWVRGVTHGLGTLLLGTTVTAVVVVAAPAVREGRLTGPGLAVLALLTIAAFEATIGLANAIRERDRVAAGLDRVAEVLDTRPVVPEPTGPEGRPAGHDIVVRRLRARWPGSDHDALRDVDLDLAPGRRVAVVGPSGSGKSTLLASLLRFCPSGGDVRIGGVPLEEIPEEHLRPLIGLAAADAHVFDSTLAANLTLARPDATEADLWRVLTRAGLRDWVLTLPRGLDTPVGEHGRNLSGGQRQRLALARALLADVPVLLCDEPDASLDPALADRLVGDLLAAAGDRTVVVVTHRLASVDGVDEIVVVEDGRVTARGTHDDLVARPGWYRDRWFEPLARLAGEGRANVAGRDLRHLTSGPLEPRLEVSEGSDAWDTAGTSSGN